MHDVRLTFQPGKVVRVSEQEFTDLNRQGLILEEVQPKAPAKTVPVRTVTTEGSKTPTGNKSAGDK